MGVIGSESDTRAPRTGRIPRLRRRPSIRNPHEFPKGTTSIRTMSRSVESTDVAIVGGGIVGLAVAWRARERGMAVTVLERDTTGRGTSHVAAGMLAPVAEVEFGEAGRRLLELGLRSAELWPEFAMELQELSGEGV